MLNNLWTAYQLTAFALVLCRADRSPFYTTVFGMGEAPLKPCMDSLLSRYRWERYDRISTFYKTGALGVIYNEVDPVGFPVQNISSQNSTYKPAVNFVVRVGRLDPKELERRPFITMIPILALPIVLVNSLVDTPLLRLTGDQILGIFNLSPNYTKWSAESLRNVGMNLPSPPGDGITVVVRDDDTPSNLIMRQSLTALNLFATLNSSWSATSSRSLSESGSEIQSPLKFENSSYKYAISSLGVLGAVVTRDNSIGYVDYSDWKIYCADPAIPCRMSSVLNSAGTMVDVNDISVNEALKTMKLDRYNQGAVSYGDATGARSYPFVNLIYMVVRNTGPNSSTPSDCVSQAETVRFIRWMAYSTDAMNIAKNHSYFYLPNSTYATTVENALKTIKCGPENASSAYDFMLSKIAEEDYSFDYSPIWGTLLGILGGVLLAYATGQLIWKAKQLSYYAERQVYIIREENIKIIKASREKYHCMMHFRKYLEGRKSTPVFVVGEYKADVVMLSRIDLHLTTIQDKALRIRLVKIMRQIAHPNVVHFYGLTEHSAFKSNCFSVSQFCPLGDLRTALDNRRNELDAPIKFGMAKGIAEGLAYLHENNIIHGNLRSSIIFLEADWTTRISDWQTTEIEIRMDEFRNRERIWKMELTPGEEATFLPALLWSAPEILTAVSKDQRLFPTKECDVYSFSIIFFEILTRDLPYEYQNVPRSMSFEQLFAMIKRSIRPMRPLDFKDPDQIAQGIPQAVIHVMKTGWSAAPKDRPKMREIRNILRAVSSEMKRLADLTIVNTRTQIEQYKKSIIKNSEETVEMTKELVRTETDFLTHWVYETEQEGGVVEPKFYQVAYILHCSLVHYDELCAVAHGDAVLYFTTRFCHIVDQVLPPDRNIHRLHSNGDDVTIIAAIPSGGVEYAAKMASTALDLLAGAWRADLLDIDWDRMEVRIGLACGPAIAGIYGNTHRGFTVIGTARDEAVMVENASAAYRILVTEAFYEALKIYPDFTTQENHDERYACAGKKTYWLQGQERYKHQKVLEEIEKIYPPIVRGRLPDVVRAAQSRVQPKQKQTKLSVQAPVGFYIQKDPRSGYTVEHYPDRLKEASARLPRVREHEAEHARHHHPAHHHLAASHSQSKLFGSMLGPQGFATYQHQYAATRKERRSQAEEETKELSEDLLLGQIGYGRLSLSQPEDEYLDSQEYLKEEAVQTNFSLDSTMYGPLEDVSAVMLRKDLQLESLEHLALEQPALSLTFLPEPVPELERNNAVVAPTTVVLAEKNSDVVLAPALPTLQTSQPKNDFTVRAVRFPVESVVHEIEKNQEKMSADVPDFPVAGTLPRELANVHITDSIVTIPDKERVLAPADDSMGAALPTETPSESRHRKRREREKESIVEVLRKTSEWVNQLPDPDQIVDDPVDLDTVVPDDDAERAEARRRRKSRRQKRRKKREREMTLTNEDPAGATNTEEEK